SNMLKPALATDEIKCIGATTFEEYRKHFIQSKAFSRRFQKVDIKEPSKEETIKILKGIISKYETHYQIKYTDEAIKTAVKLSDRFLHEKKLPDKAIDVIDEAGAANSIAPINLKKNILDVHDIEVIVSEMASIPSQKINTTDKSLLKNLYNNLKLLIYGQDEAILKITSAIKLSRSGLSIKNRPIGNFLFCGPTGVGKTELAKQLAFNLDIEFIRYDMSEYMESHTVSRLIGAPPGYVGFDQGGLLTDAVSKTPHALVLLDEIEKAHLDILNILLQIMDHGTLTDHNGKKTDFQNVIIIMTTNVGARGMEKGSIGFSNEKSKPDPSKDIKKHFSPEFRNRLDAIVNFNPLSKEILLQVIDKFLSELESQLSEKDIIIKVSKEAKGWILEKGYDKSLGARPFHRIIQEHIKTPLVDEILFGELENGGEIKIELNDNKLSFDFIKREIRINKLETSDESQIC
ncbi:ATP-dependent Clp protease ATP-binding subunit ClpA, partial [bacterium B13(2017)]